MNILGLSAFGQNPAASVLKNGHLQAFAEEERFLRVKSAFGYFPLHATRYCLQAAKLSPKDIDSIAVGWDHTQYTYRIPLFLAQSWLKYQHIPGDNSFLPAIKELLDQHPTLIKKRIILALRQLDQSSPLPPIKFYSHHLSHAASTYYASGFTKAAILILDGSGEYHATSLYSGSDLSIQPLKHFDIPHSLGWFYAALGAYLGFKPYEQDGFLMGLAPYGKKSSSLTHRIHQILRLTPDGYTVDPRFTLMGYHTHSQYYSDALVDLLGPPRLPAEPLTKHHRDIAFAAQSALEAATLNLAQLAANATHSSNLCLAGGVALNVKMNGRLLESGLFKRLFVQPVSHDAGVALGAALLASKDTHEDPRFTMTHTYWGPAYSASSIKSILTQAQVSFTKPKSITATAARAIAQGKIVAWFQGRMEAGPRALGNRSILANPTIKGINDYINDHVKHRDPWRPFCPSFTQAESTLFYSGDTESHYMIVGYQIPKKLHPRISSVIHVDGSARPQTVTMRANPIYHRLLEKVGRLTGVECVLNTSLNVKGEPIARSPEDALRCFYSTGIDSLALGPYWLEK